MRRRIKRKRGPVQSKKIVKDGITFASGLEKYTYEALLNNNLFEGYENETYQLIDNFDFKNTSFEKQANGKCLKKKQHFLPHKKFRYYHLIIRNLFFLILENSLQIQNFSMDWNL